MTDSLSSVESIQSRIAFLQSLRSVWKIHTTALSVWIHTQRETFWTRNESLFYFLLYSVYQHQDGTPASQANEKTNEQFQSAAARCWISLLPHIFKLAPLTLARPPAKTPVAGCWHCSTKGDRRLRVRVEWMKSLIFLSTNDPLGL